MKPQVVGPACVRVQAALDEAMAEGALTLPSELAAHAQRCARCGPEVQSLQEVLIRLEGAAAGLPLGSVPRVVDHVIARSAEVTLAGRTAPKRPQAAWVLGQVAAVAAVLLILAGGVSYALLKVNQAVSGTEPAHVVEQLAAPLKNWTWARLRNSR